MSSDVLALVGVTFAAIVSLVVGLRSPGSGNGGSVVAAQITALGDRLDKTTARLDETTARLADAGDRLDKLEWRERLLVAYVAALLRDIAAGRTTPSPPPTGLEL